MKSFLLRHVGIFFIVGIWFLFSAPYSLQHKMPYPADYQVNSFHPWSAYERFWGPVKNAAMPDVIGQIYPWKKITVDSWKIGQIPFWNPYAFSGNPHLANYQTAAFSPFTLLFFTLPFKDAWSLIVLLQPLIAGIGLYLLLKAYKVSLFSALLGSVSFMFCGFIVVWMAYGTLSLVAACLPWLLLLIEKLFIKQHLHLLLLLFFVSVTTFFSGHFQIAFYVLFLVGSYILFKALITKKKKVTIAIILCFFLSISIASLQLIPTIRLYQEAVRSTAFLTGGGIPLQYLVTVISPDFYGNPVTRNDWLGYYAEFASFVGIIPLLLAGVALSKKNKHVFFYFFIAIITLILAIETPLLKLIGSLHIPVISTSSPSRIIILFSFSICVLSGFGLDRLIAVLKKKQCKKAMTPFLIMLLILLAVWLLLIIVKPLPEQYTSIAKRNLILPSIFLLLTCGLSIVFYYYKKHFILFAFFLFFFTCVDSLRFVQKWMPFAPIERAYADMPIIQAITKKIKNERVYGNFGQEFGNFYKLQTIEGYDPLYIRRYGEFIRAASTGTFVEAERSVVKIDKLGKYTDRALDLLGVRYILHRKEDTKKSWAYPIWNKKEKYSIVLQDEKFVLYKNNTALPRAMVFYNYEVIGKKEDSIKRFYDTTFDFRTKLLVEENLPIPPKITAPHEAKILVYSANYIKISVQSLDTGVLFLSDNYYSGWKASVNAEVVDIFRADYSFRAVVIPKGKSIVEFSYSEF